MLLENLSYKKAEEQYNSNQVFLLPVGSVEQHGPQCPLGTDFIVAETITRDATEKAGAVCLPTVKFGVAAHHRRFKGTVFIRDEVFREYIIDILESQVYHGAKRIIISNGHGGNTGMLQSAIMKVRVAHPEVAILLHEYWKDLVTVAKIFGDGEELVHACGIESSVVHACRSEFVDLELAKTLEVPRKWGVQVAGDMMISSTHEFSELGPVGNMRIASADNGMRLKEAFVDNLLDKINKFREYDISQLEE